MNQIVDSSLIERKYGPYLDGSGRLKPDAPSGIVDSLAADIFVKPALGMLRHASRSFDSDAIGAWMALVDDQLPSLRLREPVRRFCRSRRREAFLTACVKRDVEGLKAVLGRRDFPRSAKRASVESLRRFKKIALVYLARWKASPRSGSERDSLFIIRRLPVGGIERALVNLVNAIVSLDRSVDLLVLGGIDPVLGAEIDRRVDLVDLGTALKRSYTVAVNYSQWHFPEILTRGVRAARKIQWVHSDLLQIFNRFPRNLYAREYRRIDRFVCVSEAARRGFVQLYPFAEGKTSVIYSFYDMEAVRLLASEKTGIVLERDLPAVVTVARLAEAKGLDRAVRVHRRLADRGVDFRWYVVGDGPMRAELEALVKKLGLEDRFILLGLDHNPFPIMIQADLFVLPSYHEGYGLSALEAKTVGLPLVVSDFSSASEIVTDGYDGLVAPNNERGIAEAMERLILDPGLRSRFRKNLEGFRYDNAAILKAVRRELFSEETT